MMKDNERFGRNLYDDVMKMNEDMVSLSNTLETIKSHLKVQNGNKVNVNLMTKRFSRTINTRDDDNTFSRIHASRCYFNPVSC
uniref:Elf4 domain-containing protein n=1 Tax=Parastrongyloides trichosuri TaxID=131310 RepID=A0A0N5A1P9_PARTI